MRLSLPALVLAQGTKTTKHPEGFAVMKKSLEILMNEHRVIEQVLNCLEKILERCRAEGKLDRESARQALTFSGVC